MPDAVEAGDKFDDHREGRDEDRDRVEEEQQQQQQEEDNQEIKTEQLQEGEEGEASSPSLISRGRKRKVSILKFLISSTSSF